MAKIIQIDNEVITIGTDDGGIQEVRKSDCNFEPEIGDNVEIFSTEMKTIVIKKEKTQQISTNSDLQGGININVSNNNVSEVPIYVTRSKAVNKVLYCVLAILLGGIGVHKFYAGKIGTGILFLLFCWTWIPLIISLFDFGIGLCKQADANGNILV